MNIPGQPKTADDTIQQFLQALNLDPKTFVETFYTFNSSPGNITEVIQVTTPYLSANLCCFLDKTCFKVVSEKPLGFTDSTYLVSLRDNSDYYVIKLTPVVEIAMRYQPYAPLILQRLHKAFTDRKVFGASCGYSELLDISRYIGADKFANETIIGFLLDLTIQDFPIRSIIRYYDASLCPPNSSYASGIAASYTITGNEESATLYAGPPYIGVHQMEYADMGQLSRLTTSDKWAPYRHVQRIKELDDTISVREVVSSETIFEILKQLITTLDFLQTQVQFTHGHLISSKVFVKSDPVDAVYKGIPLNADFTCKIADYDKSSLIVDLGAQNESQPYKIYNRSSVTDTFLDLPGLPYQVLTGFETIGRTTTAYYVLPPNFDEDLYTRLRYMGVPFYSQFDVYTLMVSMLLIPDVFSVVTETEDYRKIFWDPLWFPKDTQLMYNRISRLIEGNYTVNLQNVILILQGIRLKCEITPIIIQALSDY